NSCLYRLRDETDEEHLGKLKSQIKGKESEIHSLKKKLDCLVAENSKLEERIMSVSSLEFTFRAASRHVNSVSRFCGQKYLLLVHPSMEASFFGNLDMSGLVLLGSLDPKAKIFGCQKRN
ncbi:hypothetical protein HID58_051689, partial [Brassica napus]